MGLKILVRSENDRRKGQAAAVRLRGSGVFTFNRNAVELIGLKHDDRVVFAEESGVFYIINMGHERGFRVRGKDEKQAGMTCNCKSMVDKIAIVYDVEFGKRIKSVRFDLRKSDITYSGCAVFEIVNRELSIEN